MRHFLALVIASAAFVTLPNSALSHNDDFAITSGDICAPVNVGKANRNIQNIRGIIQNISTFESIAVSCPLINIYGNQTFGVLADVINFDTRFNSFKCVLREKSRNGTDLQTLSETVDLQPGFYQSIVFDSVRQTDTDSRFNLTCLLPPESGLGSLMTESY
jgi:hypothetical protein